jgi:hypothetical protein
MMQTIYCLELAGGRFYVGQTPVGRFPTRYEEHFRGGSKWTLRFKPVRVMWTRDVPFGDADRIEDAEVLKIMLEHGANSCRGGTFNIARDVSFCPMWAKRGYRDNWVQIASR